MAVLLALVYAASTFAFPLEDFQGIVNTKPTIEAFEFKVRGKKSVIVGADEDAYRVFHLRYHDQTGFCLVEDRRGYDSYRQRFFVGRYQDTYWHLFNSNDVVTAVSTGPSLPLNEVASPVGVANRSLGIALDALNLGIMDLGNIGVRWRGLVFNCHSNLIGATIEGELELDPEGQPKGALMKYSYKGGTYPYRVSYDFTKDARLPEFFPSRIKVEFLGNQKPTILLDYEIVAASFSRRELASEDFEYAKWLGTNSKRFIFTNSELFFEDNVTGSRMLRPVRNAPYRPTDKSRRFVLLLLLLSVSITFLVCMLSLDRLRRRRRLTTKTKGQL